MKQQTSDESGIFNKYPDMFLYSSPRLVWTFTCAYVTISRLLPCTLCEPALENCLGASIGTKYIGLLGQHYSSLHIYVHTSSPFLDTIIIVLTFTREVIALAPNT